MTKSELRSLIKEEIQKILKESADFKTREDVIAALEKEFNKNPKSFDYNKTAKKIWTMNRLLHYYRDLKSGRKK